MIRRATIYWYILLGALAGLILGCAITNFTDSGLGAILGSLLGGVFLTLLFLIFWQFFCPHRPLPLQTTTKEDEQPLL
jgi:hypothetical protein